jgi:hypothetical protein
MRDLADHTHYPHADRIRVVLDNLSTHTAGAIYETFPAQEANRILQRLEFHYTPKHASWLNMVEIEIGVLRGQCLDRRIGEREVLNAEVAAWQKQRNASARLSAFYAARERVVTSRSKRRRGINTVSVIVRDIEKFGGDQSTRRTAAMASVKVGSFFWYQAAACERRFPPLASARPLAQTVINENNPSNAGVVRRMARSDH